MSDVFCGCSGVEKGTHVEGGAVRIMREAREVDLWGHRDLKEEAFWKESSKRQGPISP